MGFAPTFPFELYWRLPPSDYSAIHSILLGSWAEGGVLAVLLPLWLLVACIGVVWNNARFGRWTPLVLTVALQGIWDLSLCALDLQHDSRVRLHRIAVRGSAFPAAAIRPTDLTMYPSVSAVIPTLGRPLSAVRCSRFSTRRIRSTRFSSSRMRCFPCLTR